MFFKIDVLEQIGVQLLGPFSLVCTFSGEKQNFKYLDKFLKYILAYFLKNYPLSLPFYIFWEPGSCLALAVSFVQNKYS